MKKVLLFLFVSLFSIHLFSADWVGIRSDQPSKTEISLVKSNVSSSTIKVSFDGFTRELVQTERGEAWLLRVDDGGVTLKHGAPEVPVLAASVIIPDLAGTAVKVISSSYTDYEDVLLAPSKGNLLRTIDPSSVAYEFGEEYNLNSFFPGELAELGDPYIVRDFRGQAIKIMPFQYNPVTRILRVYNSITLEVKESGVSDINVINREQPMEVVSRPFHEVYKGHFLNYEANGMRYNPVEEEGSMIVISYGDFMDEVEPLVDWKRKKGIPCSLVDVATIGETSEDIKQFIQTAYNFGGVTFVLLVGDAAQVPSSSIGGNDSDVDYSYVDGNDHYPDLFVGRFSAQNEAHVTTQVTRTLEYEQDPIADTAWYRKAIGIASNEGPGDDGEMDYEHIRNIQDNKLIPYTYNYGYEFFAGSQGGNDAPGNPNASMVATCVNSGATIINYTGHGSTSAWSTSGFNSGDVNNLTNDGNWPFIISVACVNGNFVNATCFAEAWLRAEDGGEPTGAIATLMSTINQSWNPPMHGQDEMNDILSEAYTNNIKRTFGGITMNGCMGMNDAYGSQGYEMTDTWTIFGDPSVVVRTDIPSEMNVSHVDTLGFDETSVTITCDAEGGLAALTLDGVILGTAMVEDGEAVISFPPLDEAGTADIVVTAYNYRPYMSTIDIVGILGPMVVYADNDINDELGNDDGMVDYGEEIMITVDLENIGMEDALNVNGHLSTSNPFIEIVHSDTLYGDILSGETASVDDGFTFIVSGNIPDGETIEFSIMAADDGPRGAWESVFELMAHAPAIESGDYIIDDADGNDNGRLDAGETVDLTIDLTNMGSSAAYNLMGQLVTASEYVSVLTEEVNLGDLQAGGDMASVTFSVTAAGDTPLGTIADFTLNVVADRGFSYDESFTTIVGKKPVLLIDFTVNSSSMDTLLACMDNMSIVPDEAVQIPEYPDMYQTIFVLLGVYPNNHILTEEEGMALATFLENGGRVYMEGGDTWFNDDPTTVHAMFNIQGTEDGSNDAALLMGEKDTFLEGFEFSYTGENNFIDRIEPLNDAMLMISNTDPIYGVAVASENETYKTFGASVPIGGFEDHIGSTKEAMVAEILDFFEVGFIWTGVDDPESIEISATAYPNPFLHDVTIVFSLEREMPVVLEVYDLTGRKIRTLANENLGQGQHRMVWDAEQDNSNHGIYFYHLQVGDRAITRKIVFGN